MKNNCKRRLSLLGIAVMAFLLVGCSSSLSESGERNRDDTKVDVLMNEYSFSLEKSQVEQGRITFILLNQGSVSHDFALRGNGVDQAAPMIDPGKSATLTVDLEPGTYTIVCTIPGHEPSGMIGILTVTSKGG